jgi:hypothetical protein
MASLFKRFRKKLPAVSTRNSAYYSRESLIQTVPDLQRILMGGAGIKGFKTEKALTFNNIPLLEITPRVLKSSFDTPSHVLDNSSTIAGHKIVYYKDSIAHYKFLIQYHFVDEMFFFASNKISSMTILSDNDKIKITDRITRKYIGEKKTDDARLVLKVTDPNGSIIYTVDDVYFYLHYLPENETKKMLIGKYAEASEHIVKPKGFNDTLEQYI